MFPNLTHTIERAHCFRTLYKHWIALPANMVRNVSNSKAFRYCTLIEKNGLRIVREFR